MNHLNRQAHFVPAIALFFLAPLVGEFLLGNLPASCTVILLILAKKRLEKRNHEFTRSKQLPGYYQNGPSTGKLE